MQLPYRAFRAVGCGAEEGEVLAQCMRTMVTLVHPKFLLGPGCKLKLEPVKVKC